MAVVQKITSYAVVIVVIVVALALAIAVLAVTGGSCYSCRSESLGRSLTTLFANIGCNSGLYIDGLHI